jgi:putative aminopeptidase FrvX
MSPDASHDITFLERLLDSPGPSGFESRPARVWRDEAGSFAETWSDVVGNSYAAVRRDAGDESQRDPDPAMADAPR